MGSSKELEDAVHGYTDWIASYNRLTNTGIPVLYGMEEKRIEMHDRIAEPAGVDRYVVTDIVNRLPVITEENKDAVAECILTDLLGITAARNIGEVRHE